MTRSLRGVAIWALCLGCGSAWAQAPTPLPDDDEARLLRESLAADQAQTAPAPAVTTPAITAAGAPSSAIQDTNPDLSVILDVAGAWFSADDPMQAGGHDPTHTGFTFQQLELALGASIDPYFRFDANLVFSPFGVEVEDAYGTTLALPWNLQLRAGQFLTRFGRINPTHPHSWSFVDQPIVIGKLFGSEGSRGLGAELSWLAPLPWYLELVASTTEATGACCARSFWGAEDLGVDTPLDLLVTLALKQFFALAESWSLLAGLSAQLGPNPTGNGTRTEIYGADLYLRWRPIGSPEHVAVALTAEGLMRRRQVPHDVLVDGGGYAQLVWRFARRWEIGARAEWVSGASDDPLDPAWTSGRQRYAAQGTFYPSHFSRLRLQGGADLPGWRDEVGWAVIANLELVAGAHGAHAYQERRGGQSPRSPVANSPLGLSASPPA